MVGDGINDAPVLAGADVSLALGDGAALAQRAADFVVTGPLAAAHCRRRSTWPGARRRIVRQNLAWAVGYNLVALPLAAAGQVTPWVAALGMALSSLLVTLNALRLARPDRNDDDHDHPAAAGTDRACCCWGWRSTAFVWAVRRGQFEDLDTPALDILRDDDGPLRAHAPAAAGAGDRALPASAWGIG